MDFTFTLWDFVWVPVEWAKKAPPENQNHKWLAYGLNSTNRQFIREREREKKWVNYAQQKKFVMVFQ